MSDEDKNGARMTTRLPRRLLEELRRLAQRDRRSLNAYVVVALERLVRDEAYADKAVSGKGDADDA
jgi:predicted HicB family RNase H-like nuclease